MIFNYYIGSAKESIISPFVRKPTLGIMQIKTVVHDTVDENHSIVKDLVSAGYTVQQGIDAMEKYGTLEGALDYLGTIDIDEEEDELFPSTYKPQLSSEDSQPNDTFKMKWYVACYMHEAVILVSMYRRKDDPPTIHSDPEVEDGYLNLKELGSVLKKLSEIMPGEYLFDFAEHVHIHTCLLYV